MRLVEEGRLDLDAPVSMYLTRWQLPPSRFDASGVTVRRLLSHTAGLSDTGYLGYDTATELPSLETELSQAPDATLAEGGAQVAYPPGEGWHYSGGAYTLLQLLIEEVSGQPFATYMQQQVLTPLGMTHSTFTWSPAVHAALATPYASDGTALPDYRFTSEAAAGLYATASDLATFIASSVDSPSGEPRGRSVLTSTTIDLMLSPAPNASVALGPFPLVTYGLGYFIHSVLLGGPAVVGHDGTNRGWKNALLLEPGRGEGIVILTNSERGGALHAEVQAGWLSWMTGSTTAASVLDVNLPTDGVSAVVTWLALVVIVLLGPVLVRTRS